MTQETRLTYELESALPEAQQLAKTDEALRRTAMDLGATGIRLDGPQLWSNPPSQQKSEVAYKVHFLGVPDDSASNTYRSISIVKLDDKWRILATGPG